MAFNDIIGAGSIPQVTQDVQLNPYGLADDITHLIFPTFDIYAGAPTINDGSLVNLTNPNFDYVTYNTLRVTDDGVGGVNTFAVTLDFGKLLQIRGLLFFVGYDSTTSGTMDAKIEISTDRSTWTTLDTWSLSGITSGSYTYELENNYYRFVRVYVSWTNSTGVKNFYFKKVIAKLNAIQKYY